MNNISLSNNIFNIYLNLNFSTFNKTMFLPSYLIVLCIYFVISNFLYYLKNPFIKVILGLHFAYWPMTFWLFVFDDLFTWWPFVFDDPLYLLTFCIWWPFDFLHLMTSKMMTYNLLTFCIWRPQKWWLQIFFKV